MAGEPGESRIDEGVFIFVPQPKIYAVRERARVQYDAPCYLCTLLKLDRPDRTFSVQVSYTILLTPFLFCFGKILGEESSWGTGGLFIGCEVVRLLLRSDATLSISFAGENGEGR